MSWFKYYAYYAYAALITLSACIITGGILLTIVKVLERVK